MIPVLRYASNLRCLMTLLVAKRPYYKRELELVQKNFLSVFISFLLALKGRLQVLKFELCQI